MCATDLPAARATRLPRHNHRPGPATFLRHPITRLLPPGFPRSPTTLIPEGTSNSRFGWLAHSGLAAGRPHAGTGISTRYPSTTPHGLALGPDSPRADKLDPGTLGHPAAGILTLHSLLMPAFSLQPPPPQLTSWLPRQPDAPLPTHTPTNHPAGQSASLTCRCRGFGGVLKPRYIIGAQPLDQ
jgi:hypothetical protein